MPAFFSPLSLSFKLGRLTNINKEMTVYNSHGFNMFVEIFHFTYFNLYSTFFLGEYVLMDKYFYTDFTVAYKWTCSLSQNITLESRRGKK